MRRSDHWALVGSPMWVWCPSRPASSCEREDGLALEERGGTFADDPMGFCRTLVGRGDVAAAAEGPGTVGRRAADEDGRGGGGGETCLVEGLHHLAREEVGARDGDVGARRPGGGRHRHHGGPKHEGV